MIDCPAGKIQTVGGPNRERLKVERRRGRLKSFKPSAFDILAGIKDGQWEDKDGLEMNRRNR